MRYFGSTMKNKTNYRHALHHPQFRNQRNEVMPNTGGWQGRHLAAINDPIGAEVPIAGMLAAWAGYADMHRSRYGSSIGDDGVLGEAWCDIGRAIRTLFNGECGRFDCGTLDAYVCDSLTNEGFRV